MLENYVGARFIDVNQFYLREYGTHSRIAENLIAVGFQLINTVQIGNVEQLNSRIFRSVSINACWTRISCLYIGDTNESSGDSHRILISQFIEVYLTIKSLHGLLVLVNFININVPFGNDSGRSP